MEALTKKTTILLSPDLHARLTDLARSENTSIGELVRRAVVSQFGIVDVAERAAAARELRELRLPVATPARMKHESVAGPGRLA